MTHLKVIMFFALVLVGSGERLITGGFVLFWQTWLYNQDINNLASYDWIWIYSSISLWSVIWINLHKKKLLRKKNFLLSRGFNVVLVYLIFIFFNSSDTHPKIGNIRVAIEWHSAVLSSSGFPRGSSGTEPECPASRLC